MAPYTNGDDDDNEAFAHVRARLHEGGGDGDAHLDTFPFHVPVPRGRYKWPFHVAVTSDRYMCTFLKRAATARSDSPTHLEKSSGPLTACSSRVTVM